MGRNTKDEIKYFLINAILLLISIALIGCIVLALKGNKENIAIEFEENKNITNFVIAEGQDNIKTNNLQKDNEQANLPPIYASMNNETNSNNVSIGSNPNNTENGEYDFNEIKNDRYYYNQLNNNARLIYSSIEKNLDKMKTGTYEIELPNEIANTLKYDEGREKLDTDFQSAWNAITLDRMDSFFLDISKIRLLITKYTRGTEVSYELKIAPLDENGYLIDSLADKNSVDTALVKAKEIRDIVANNVSGNNYNKILQVHDWIIENFEYSPNFQDENVYNIYGALVEKEAVCEGYAESFKYILDEIGIPCVIVSGTATNSEGETENHAWNYVQLNGSWYVVDTTWDDPVIRGFGQVSNSEKHKYFLQGSNFINSNHFSNGKLTENGQEFTYPQLSFNSYEQ